MTAAIIESKRYADEANELAKHPVVVAAAADMILNDVEFDPNSFEFMQSANNLLSQHDLAGGSIGGAARAIGVAHEKLLKDRAVELNPTHQSAAHAVAVSIYVAQPDVKKIEALHHNILEIFSAVNSVHVTPNPIASFEEVARFFLVVRDSELND